MKGFYIGTYFLKDNCISVLGGKTWGGLVFGGFSKRLFGILTHFSSYMLKYFSFNTNN